MPKIKWKFGPLAPPQKKKMLISKDPEVLGLPLGKNGKRKPNPNPSKTICGL